MSDTARIAIGAGALLLSAGYGLVLARIAGSAPLMRHKAFTVGQPVFIGIAGAGWVAAITGNLGAALVLGAVLYVVVQITVLASRRLNERLFYLTPESQDRSGRVPPAVTASQDRYVETVHASPRYRWALWGAAALLLVLGGQAFTIIGDKLPGFVLAGMVVSFLLGAAIFALLGWLQATLRVEVTADGLGVRFGLNRGRLAADEVGAVSLVPFPGTYGGWSRTMRVFWVPSVPEGVEVISKAGRKWYISSREPAALAGAIEAIAS